MKKLALLALAAVLSLAACNSSNGTNNNGVFVNNPSNPYGACQLPQFVPSSSPTLLYPTPGSTGNTRSITNVYIASNPGVPATYEIDFLIGSTIVAKGGRLANPTSLPSGVSAPNFGSPQYAVSTFNVNNSGSANLPANTPLDVWLRDTSNDNTSTPCSPNFKLGTITTGANT